MKELILSKEPKLKNGIIVMLETKEIHLSKQDLLNAKENLKRQKQQLIQQSKNIKEDYLERDKREREIDELLALFPENELEEIKGIE